MLLRILKSFYKCGVADIRYTKLELMRIGLKKVGNLVWKRHINMYNNKLLLCMFTFVFIPFYVEAFTESELNELKGLNIPLFIIETTDGVNPSCEYISPPEGCIGETIQNNEYVTGSLIVILENDTVYNSGRYVENKGGMKLKIRGNTSAYTAYPPYKLKLEKKENLFFLHEKPKEKEYVLLRTASSNRLNPFLGNKVGELLGADWQPKSQFVNIILNNEYRGLYLLSDVIKKGKSHCDISASGYLMENDAYWWADEGKTFQGNYLARSLGYTFKYPETLSNEEFDYIKNYVISFEEDLYAGKPVSKWIDYESFAIWVLAHDLLGSVDGAGSNIYITKYDNTENSKLRMGPLWDFDGIFQEENLSSIHFSTGCFYYPKLFKLQEFCGIYSGKWQEIRNVLYDDIMSMTDSIVSNYGTAIDLSRDYTRRICGVNSPSMESNVTEISEWFSERISLIDELSVDVGITAEEPICEEMRIYDFSGRLLNVVSVDFCIEKLQLSPGLYIMCFYNNNNIVGRNKIVIY